MKSRAELRGGLAGLTHRRPLRNDLNVDRLAVPSASVALTAARRGLALLGSIRSRDVSASPSGLNLNWEILLVEI